MHLFNKSILISQNKPEAYGQFNHGNIDWTKQNAQEHLIVAQEKEAENKNVFSGFMSSTNDQFIDHMNHSEHKQSLTNIWGESQL